MENKIFLFAATLVQPTTNEGTILNFYCKLLKLSQRINSV